jgi:hypothetical protein
LANSAGNRYWYRFFDGFLDSFCVNVLEIIAMGGIIVLTFVHHLHFRGSATAAQSTSPFSANLFPVFAVFFLAIFAAFHHFASYALA